MVKYKGWTETALDKARDWKLKRDLGNRKIFKEQIM